jgi:uncharacterized cupredoxin-like copper-binding protein
MEVRAVRISIRYFTNTTKQLSSTTMAPNIRSTRKASLALLSLAALSLSGHAATTKINNDRFAVTESVAFTIGNSSTSSFLFNWTDGASSFSNEEDVTFVLTLGQTYTFQRTTSSHPFAIMDSSASGFISGSDGSFVRTSTDSADITGATLTPVADFTADPSPTTDLITWTPDTIGDYYYTCTVTGHTGMTGKFEVVPEPTVAFLAGIGALSLMRRRRS